MDLVNVKAEVECQLPSKISPHFELTAIDDADRYTAVCNRSQCSVFNGDGWLSWLSWLVEIVMYTTYYTAVTCFCKNY